MRVRACTQRARIASQVFISKQLAYCFSSLLSSRAPPEIDAGTARAVGRIGNSANRFCQILQGTHDENPITFCGGLVRCGRASCWFAERSRRPFATTDRSTSRPYRPTDLRDRWPVRRFVELPGARNPRPGHARHGRIALQTAGAASPSHEHLDKDLATLDHYRVQFDKQCDVLARELRGLWGDGSPATSLRTTLRLLWFRLDSIERLSTAIDRHVHPGRADSVPPGDLSSRPGTCCPADVIPVPALPDLPLPGDPRPVDPAPADPAPLIRGPSTRCRCRAPVARAWGQHRFPTALLPRPRIPDGLVPGPAIRRPDLGSLIPLPGIGAGGGSGSGSGRHGIPRDRLLPGVGHWAATARDPAVSTGIPRDRLLPGVGDTILGGAIGSGSGSAGRTPGIPRDRLLPGVATPSSATHWLATRRWFGTRHGRRAPRRHTSSRLARRSGHGRRPHSAARSLIMGASDTSDLSLTE